jgi:phospholipid/cholesterol/gamma-HCH transport system substrate-binding protein
MFDDISSKLDPVTAQLKTTMLSLDSVLRNVNSIFDPNTKGNLQSIISNLNKATAGIVVSTGSLQKLLNTETGALAISLDNVNSFTKNLADNNGRIDSVLANLQTTTRNLSKADIDGAVNQLKASINKLNDVMAKFNSQDGTLGALINNKELYNSINNTMRSLNTLADDLRVHPKRYVNISVFGKKDKGDYLTAPLKDSSNSSPKK